MAQRQTEYFIKNKGRLIIKKKEYRENNKDKLARQKIERRQKKRDQEAELLTNNSVENDDEIQIWGVITIKDVRPNPNPNSNSNPNSIPQVPRKAFI
jgi:hypothetical protein